MSRRRRQVMKPLVTLFAILIILFGVGQLSFSYGVDTHHKRLIAASSIPTVAVAGCSSDTMATETTSQNFYHVFENITIEENPLPYVPISVIIPATVDRLSSKVSNLLSSIAVGTRLPMEVVVAVTSLPNTTFDFQLEVPRNLHVRVVGTPGRKRAAANRNTAAEHATMPVLAAVDSDDIVGSDWMETVFNVFNNSSSADALLHKWFSCRNRASIRIKGASSRTRRVPAINKRMESEKTNTTWSLQNSDRILYVNDIIPANLSLWEATKWVSHAEAVDTAPRFSDPGLSHPWWAIGHVSVKRQVYLEVTQREDMARRLQEDSAFVADLLLRGYRVGSILNQLTGYCKY